MSEQQPAQHAKVFGRNIYEAAIVGKKPGKVPDITVNISIGHNEFEVFTKDWKQCLHSFNLDKGSIEAINENTVHITYQREKSNQTFEFYLRFERIDLMLNAFALAKTEKKVNEPAPISQFEQSEVFCFGCSMPIGLAQQGFKPHLEAQARKRVLFLSSSTEISSSLVNAIACEFRMRFPQIEPENWTEAFEVLWFEFVAFSVSLWTQCLKSVIEPHTGPNSFEYFRRLAASMAALLTKGADAFNVDRRPILLATRKFIEVGDSSDILQASRQLVSDVGNVRKRWLLQLSDLFEFTQLFTSAVTISQAVAGESKEQSQLSDYITSWSLSLVNSLARGPRIVDFKNSLEKLAVSVLKDNDSKRYGPDFHCVLALWKLSELVKSTE